MTLLGLKSVITVACMILLLLGDGIDLAMKWALWIMPVVLVSMVLSLGRPCSALLFEVPISILSSVCGKVVL